MLVDLPTSLAALVACALLTWATIRIARWKGWLFAPRADRWHKIPVAKFGGVPIALTLIVFGFASAAPSPIRAVLALSGSMAALGLCDDLFDLSPRIKLAIEVLIAVAAVSSGIIYPLTFNVWVNGAMTVLWLVGISNAINLLDNMDGLAAGVSIIALINLVVVLDLPAAVDGLLLVMAGTLTGFLIFNFQPAKIFMGDTGSLCVGFFLGCAAILGAHQLSTTISVLFVPGLMLFLPIFDVALVSVTRRLSGRAISAGAKDHSSHRLVTLGLSERGSVLTLYAVSFLSGIVAYLWKHMWPSVGPGFVMLFLVGAAMFWLYLAKIRLPDDWLSRSTVFTFALPEFLDSMATSAGMMFLDTSLILVSLCLAFLFRFSGIPERTLPTFFLAATLAVVIKVPLLAVFATYRRGWALRSLSDVYPIAKASVIGTLCLVTILTFTIRFEEASRTAFLVDCVLTVVLLCTARASGRIFDDMFTRPRNGGLLLFGGPSAEFYSHYFDSLRPRKHLLAIAASEPLAESYFGAAKVVSKDEGINMLGDGSVEGVYLLPDCAPLVRMEVLDAAERARIEVSEFDFSVKTLKHAGSYETVAD